MYVPIKTFVFGKLMSIQMRIIYKFHMIADQKKGRLFN